MAMWDGEGRARRMGTMCRGRPGSAPWARSSHTPGPVSRTVPMPLRKSGIPQLEREGGWLAEGLSGRLALQ